MIRRKELAGMILAAGLAFALLNPYTIRADESVAGSTAADAVQTESVSASGGDTSDVSSVALTDSSAESPADTAANTSGDVSEETSTDTSSTAEPAPKETAAYTLTIEYRNENGEKLLDSQVRTVNEGEAYTAEAESIEGYLPYNSAISGTMDSDTTVTFVYKRNALQHALQIFYIYEDGSEAAPSVTRYLENGADYAVASPSVTGCKADTETVSGTMASEDVKQTVTYKKQSHTLTVNFKKTDGTTVAPSVTSELAYGDVFQIASPDVKGMTAQVAAATGTMGEQDITADVLYSVDHYTLTIIYADEDGNQLDSYVKTYEYGDEYSVESPEIDGYDTRRPVVEGNITGDETYTVTYFGAAAQSSTYSTDTNKNQTTYSYTNYRTPSFTKVDKVYAIAKGDQYINIREGKSTASRIVGTLETNGVCFILADADSDWVYVESGEVRGFVSKEFLTTGDEAAAYVKTAGEANLKTAQETISSSLNAAYRYTLTTTRNPFTMIAATRQLMISYAEKFLGNPYVWGGTSLTQGCDCSGFVQQIYAAFGITLPRCSYEQAEAGTKIAANEAVPGDLIFYANGGVVYHVLMYIGNGQAINAASSATGIIISNVDYSKACWACNFLSDIAYSSTQASNWTTIGQQAYEGDTSAQQQIINVLAQAANKAWYEYGFCRSVLIAQAIEESGWLSFSGAANGGIQPTDNNILGMNADLLNGQWVSNWTGTAAMRNVPQSVNGTDVYGYESMRTYADIESCMEDYAAYKTGIHPDMKGVIDVDKVISTALAGYATDPDYDATIKSIIEKYQLTKYDTTGLFTAYSTDTSKYTDDEMNLIYAIVAQEDDTSYEGALGVITCAMNRADLNYGGYGTTALAQLTASGQFCYSPSISDPSAWQKRLNGNVADFVKKAVSDCLTQGIRNHGYLNFRSTNRTGNYIQVGSNWYF